jgi:hypothetical protein
MREWTIGHCLNEHLVVIWLQLLAYTLRRALPEAGSKGLPMHAPSSAASTGPVLWGRQGQGRHFTSDMARP